MPVSVAREIVDRTPEHLRSAWSRNPGGIEVELTKHHHFLPFSTKEAAQKMARLLRAEGVKAEVKKIGGEWGVDHTHANPFYGEDLDLETSMAPAWMYYDSKEARDQAARLYEGQGKKIIREHSLFGYRQAGGKRWRLRAASHMGNPSKAFGGSVHEQLVSAATQYDMKEEAKAAKRRAAGKQGYHNIYTLPQYLNRISEVEADIAAGAPVRKAVTAAFTGRLQDAMLKAVGEPKGTLDEVRGTGSWAYSPASKQNGNPGSFYQRTIYSDTRHEIGEVVNNSVFGPVQITARRETNDPEKRKYEYDIETVTSTGRKRRSTRPYGPGPGKRYRSNPDGAAEEMFESFHGEPSDETVEYVEEEHYHSHVSALGELVELKVKLVNGDKAVIGFDAGSGKETENPFWPFNSFTHSTIYHVGTGEKYKKSGSFKGYTLYQKLDTGEYLVPALDKESRFDTLKDAREFVNSWTKHQKNPKRKRISGPFSEAGKLVGGITRGATRPVDEFLGTAGKVGGYLDSQIGRALNPDHKDTGPVLLCSSEDGQQLHLVGGDQSLDIEALDITGDMASKESIVIGDITNITYHTRKNFDGKPEEFDYTHKAGEITGDLPTLRYDRINRQLFIDGGAYKIEKPKGETSPGIEN